MGVQPPSLRNFPYFGLVSAPDSVPPSASAAFRATPVELASVPLWYVRHGAAAKQAISDLPLTAQDHIEFSRMRFAPARRRSLRTRARLREALTASSGGVVSPLEWTFERDCNGKPYLPGTPDLHFSCSHSPAISVIAVCKQRPVGIDIAGGTTIRDLSLMDGFLSANERRGLAELPKEAVPTAIARLWSLKEAVVKMLGIGFSFDLSHLDFDVDRDRLRSIPGELQDLNECRFATSAINERSRVYSVAIAFRG